VLFRSIKAAAVPIDAAADAKRAQARAQALEADVQDYADEAHALEDEAKDDAALAKAEHRVQVDEAEASEAAAKTAKPTLSGGTSTPSKPAGPSSN